MKYDWELTEEEFGPFYSYIQDKNILWENLTEEAESGEEDHLKEDGEFQETEEDEKHPEDSEDQMRQEPPAIPEEEDYPVEDYEEQDKE